MDDPEYILRSRIRSLEERIAPLETELKYLRRQLRTIVASKKSADARRKTAQSLDNQILKLAKERTGDKYRRNGGMVNSIAEELGISTRRVSQTINKK